MSHALVLSATQMRAVDEMAASRHGIPTLLLMENAGRGVAELVRRRFAPPPGRGSRLRVRVVAGAGNNAGDGFVAARHLALGGADVRVLLGVPRPRIGGDAAQMLAALDGIPGVMVTDLAGAFGPEEWDWALGGGDVIVDALFGTGLRSDVTGVPAVAIGSMNSATAPTVAIDIPSGLDADSGRPRGVAVRADVTITMGARKLGLVLDPDAGAGEVEVVGLGIPVVPPAELAPYCFWLDESTVRAELPRRRRSAHKGSGGHLIVVAGSPGRTGAAVLTARAALRSGAGLVTVASTADGQVALDAKVTEAMTACYTAGEDADASSLDAIAALVGLPNVRAVALGPGIPRGPGMRELVRRLVGGCPVPMVVDADGLNMLGEHAAAIVAGAPAPRVLTPHPGEMARLAGRSSADVQADRLGTARGFAGVSGAVVVLKGARTVIAAPDGTTYVNPAAEPALATAGTGDVLTGVIGALLSQGMAPLESACAGVFLHGLAGAAAARSSGASGVIAGDLPEAVASVRAAWEAGES